ncbi:MAG: hypothetical protein J0H66_03530 [Solirubrobacterales bacterium]|nr:hypothetical protein [Solirubrobacterales bacterium]OJU96168.1 MAG: hypothetical protein BGO23_01195 [Solirubrobacterales bacterium 67-14]
MWNEPTSQFEVFLFRRSRFRDSASLPEGFAFEAEPSREAEQRLLKIEYPQWEIPFDRRFPGGSDASVLGVRDLSSPGDDLAGLIYLSFENELDLPGYGQIHYPVVSPEFRRRGIYAPMLTSLLREAESDETAGLILVSDREDMADIYERWGAELVGAYSRPGKIRRRLGRVVDPRRKIRARIIDGADPARSTSPTGGGDDGA